MRRRTRNEQQLQIAARKALAGVLLLVVLFLCFCAAVVHSFAVCAW